MELDIFDGQDVCGKLFITETDGRFEISARCGLRDGIWRAAAEDAEGRRLELGVLAPENGRLTARRVFSKAQINSRTDGNPIRGVIWTGTRRKSGWMPCREPESLTEDFALRSSLRGCLGALYKNENGAVVLAVPLNMLQHITPAVIHSRPRLIGGAEYFTITLDSTH